MLEIFQQTISTPITFEGIGLHTGKKTKITIHRGLENQGIVFRRTDIKKNNLVYAKYDKVSSAKLCTTLENSFGVQVSTVEHLLAALYFSNIDNVLIEINNSEVPIMDGSAKEFLNVLKKTPKFKQSTKRKYLKIIEKFEYADGQKKMSIEPYSNSLEVNFKLNYKNKIIGKQSNSINLNNCNIKEITESRTFCLYEDIEKIKKIGLAKGGSLENAIVVDDEKVLNKGGLRNKKEFVNHKILDLVGDFLLSGFRIIGKINCDQGGHKLTNMFLRKLMNSKSSFEILEHKNVIISKKISPKNSIGMAVNA